VRPHTGHQPGHAKRAALLGALAFGLAGCGGSDGDSGAQSGSTEPPATAPTQPSRDATLSDIASVDQLRARFNVDEGKPRLLLLLSPT
jgi:hypothetical protein